MNLLFTTLLLPKAQDMGWIVVSGFGLVLSPVFALSGFPSHSLPSPMPMGINPLSVPTLPVTVSAIPLGRPSDYLPIVPEPIVPEPLVSEPAVSELQATHLVLNISEKQVRVLAGEQLLAVYPVAVGAPATPTPLGEFEIFQMVENPVWQSPWTGKIHQPGANSALGLRWIGFTTLDNGVIGFHGTPTVSSIGQAVSNGCVRLRNEDVLALFEQVRLGMTVIVEP